MLIKYVCLYLDAKPPERASSGAVGFDVYAYHVVDKNSRKESAQLPVTINPGESVLIGTGIAFAVPFPVDCQVRPRSGLASKYDIELSNSPGTIDPDFRGEAGILLRNRGQKPFVIEKGMRIAQLVFTSVEVPHFVKVDELPGTTRSSGGFGSTGLSAIALGENEYLIEQRKWDDYFMSIAIKASCLSNCLRGAEKNSDGSYRKDDKGLYCGATRRFGCVIVKDRNIVAQGFNTRTSECNEESGCIREIEKIPSGTSNDRGCLHAEQMAIQNHALTGGPALQGTTIYVNAEPCLSCAKLLVGCRPVAIVVPHSVYANNGLNLFLEAGIEVRQIEI